MPGVGKEVEEKERAWVLVTMPDRESLGLGTTLGIRKEEEKEGAWVLATAPGKESQGLSATPSVGKEMKEEDRACMLGTLPG